MATLNVKNWYEYEIKASLVWRIETAIEMLQLLNKIDMQQETSTPYSEFLDKLNVHMRENGYHLTLYHDFFKGNSDVIMELGILLTSDKDKKIPVRDEKIAGTVLNEVFKYFEFTNWNIPTVSGRIIGITEEVKALNVFKNN